MTPQTPWRPRQGTTTVRVTELDPDKVLRLHRLGRELRLTDQILSVDLDAISIVDSGPAAAWTSLEGDHVTFARTRMPFPNDRIDVAVWLGTNAHELGHVLFSPRRFSPLMRRTIEADKLFMPGLMQLHNIAEDQRQERLLLGKFSPWRAYLIAALAHHLVADDESAWLLMAGRTWLPENVRRQAYDRMVAVRGKWVADQIARLIGNYQKLVDPGDSESDEAFNILDRLHSLFDGGMPSLPTPCTIIRDGVPSTDGFPGGAPMTADEADVDDEGESESEDDSESQTERPKRERDPRPTSRPTTNQPDGQGGQGAGTESSKKKFDAQATKDELRDAAREQLEDEHDEAKSDLDQVLDALTHGRGYGGTEADQSTGVYRDVTDAARRLYHEVGDALLDLKDESEPGWERRTDSGRLNVRRLLVAALRNDEAKDLPALDEMFDRYEPGKMDATEMEVGLLLDISGSMMGRMPQLGEAAWAIRQAVDSLEGRITVWTFDTQHQVMSRPDERPDDKMFVPSTGGGTQPGSALADCFQLLAESNSRIRIMIVMTDGEWAGEQGDRVIAAMNQHGITTVAAFLGGTASKRSAHGCRFWGRISEPEGLARLFRKIAEARIREKF